MCALLASVLHAESCQKCLFASPGVFARVRTCACMGESWCDFGCHVCMGVRRRLRLGLGVNALLVWGNACEEVKGG